jgi:membrane fusion protein, multidrug efflux system
MMPPLLHACSSKNSNQKSNHRFKESSMRTDKIAIKASALAAAVLVLSACGGGGDAGMQMPPTEVNVSKVVQKNVAAWDEFTGRIEAVENVEVRPRVNGTLSDVHFREGSVVRKGQLLFSIDDREFRAALENANGNLARARSRAEVARTELARSQRLIAQQAISQSELETRRAESMQAQADIASAQAQVSQAKLNVEFSRITSPINGRVGAALLKPGNLVGAGTSVLTTVVSVDPVYVSFEGDERTYLRYQQFAREGSRPSSRDTQNPVRVALANEEGFPHEGRMVFVDNALNPTTGTIRARAELANPNGVFTPGLFARVRLLGSGERQTMLIHPQSVLNDQDRKFVYVVGKDEKSKADIALRKDIVLGPEVEGLVSVQSGLEPSDRIVVNGMRKIFFVGAPLKPIDVPMNAPNTIPAPPADAASVKKE